MERAERKRVLLVEDEAATRTVIGRHLRRQGLDVVEVESGEAALVEARSAAAAFDVVVSDVHLPGMSGVELASLILSKSPGQAIVLITGDPDAALAREALSRGPVSYLLKPFEMFELHAAVNQALVRRGSGADWDLVASVRGAGAVPGGWLDLVDQRSYAGPGHARRVGQIAVALAESKALEAVSVDVGEVMVAAWSHELGRLTGAAAAPVTVAIEGGRLLKELGCTPGVVDGVRNLHERWDGGGGPDGTAGEAIPMAARLLAVADSIEHYMAAWLQTGKLADDALDRALGLVWAQSGTVFCPAVVDAAFLRKDRILAISGSRTPAALAPLVEDGARSDTDATTAAA